MDRLSVGIDLGGSHVTAGIVDLSGQLKTIKTAKIDNLAPAEDTLKVIATLIKELHGQEKNVYSVGVGLPGNHDSALGICRLSPNFPQWHNVPVTSYLSKAVQLPVHMLNDVRVATLGEYHFGAGKGAKTLVMLAIGTGIGGGIIVNGNLLIGNEEAAGEIGHMTINPNGPHCNCGNQGCLEAMASGPAIAARGVAAILRGEPTKLRERSRSLEEINPKLIAETARDEDPVCLRILKQAGEAIGIAISNLAVTLNPERFIVGGGVAQSGEPLFQPMRRTIENRLYILPSKTIMIVPAQLGVHAGVVGAGAYAFMQEGIKLS